FCSLSLHDALPISELLGLLHEAGDRLRNHFRADFAQGAHLLTQQPQLLGLELREDLCRLAVFQQHHHDGGTARIVEFRELGHCVASASVSGGLSICRSAASAESGFSATRRFARPTLSDSTAASIGRVPRPVSWASRTCSGSP